jgi:hypothetical protein
VYVDDTGEGDELVSECCEDAPSEPDYVKKEFFRKALTKGSNSSVTDITATAGRLLRFAGVRGRLARVEIISVNGEGEIFQSNSVGARSGDAAVTLRLANINTGQVAHFVLLIPADAMHDDTPPRSPRDHLLKGELGLYTGLLTVRVGGVPVPHRYVDSGQYANGALHQGELDPFRLRISQTLNVVHGLTEGSPNSPQSMNCSLVHLLGGFVLIGLVSCTDLTRWVGGSQEVPEAGPPVDGPPPETPLSLVTAPSAGAPREGPGVPPADKPPVAALGLLHSQPALPGVGHDAHEATTVRLQS